MTNETAPARIIPINACALALGDVRWDFAEQHAQEIETHWEHARLERPKLFNGTIHLLRDWRLEDTTFTGTFLRTDFKSFLYWRETGYREAGVLDAFGSSLIRASDDAVLLGRQTEGNLNAGLAYPPAGMIDADDAGPEGIDIEASIVRELAEESGLGPHDLERVPGYVVTLTGPFVSIAIEWRSPLDADALRTRILKHVHSQREPELADIVIVRSRAQIDAIRVPGYAHALLSRMLPA